MDEILKKVVGVLDNNGWDHITIDSLKSLPGEFYKISAFNPILGRKDMAASLESLKFLYNNSSDDLESFIELTFPYYYDPSSECDNPYFVSKYGEFNIHVTNYKGKIGQILIVNHSTDKGEPDEVGGVQNLFNEIVQNLILGV
jgi:hypothetical protein